MSFQNRIIALLLLLFIVAAYSNHFTNGFQFDDSHTITNNEYIRDIKNLPLFFTDIKYFGTNPGNQGYRPILVSLNAIDYWLAGGYDPVYFHTSIFLSYLVLLVLLFLFFKRIFATASKEHDVAVSGVALLSVGFYGIHTANAETINYICQRADSFSTLCVVASLLLYIHPGARKYYLYLLTLAAAICTKETGVMFAPILFFYILFFEEQISMLDLVTFRKPKNIFNTVRKALPAFLVAFGLFYFIQKFIYPSAGEGAGGAADGAATSAWQYFYTQWVVIMHYIGNFILPLELSADNTFVLFDSVINQKVLLSLAVILLLVTFAFINSAKRETRPIAFGILWFFIALAPTSSFFAFGQISNDHRTFFPYIGLVISLGWWLRLMYLKYEEKISGIRQGVGVLFGVYFLVISLHAYGTYQRNIVWSSSATLWYDAAVKGPQNGRAQMNYGLTLMAAGKYDETLPYFKRTLELLPGWAFIHINMGILREAMGFSAEAEQYFQNAIRYQPLVPDSYYYYAQWLQRKDRIPEAIAQLREGNRISPGHGGIAQYLRDLEASSGETMEMRMERERKAVEANPSADNYINLSLTYYRNGMFPECVKACEKALELNPRSALAYNNMGSAYNSMGEWEKGAAACRKALEIDPGFERAKNNLKWAEDNLKK